MLFGRPQTGLTERRGISMSVDLIDELQRPVHGPRAVTWPRHEDPAESGLSLVAGPNVV